VTSPEVHDGHAFLRVTRAAAEITASADGDLDSARRTLDDVAKLSGVHDFPYFEAQASSLLAALEGSAGVLALIQSLGLEVVSMRRASGHARAGDHSVD
jgi:hypothetical protein